MSDRPPKDVAGDNVYEWIGGLCEATRDRMSTHDIDALVETVGEMAEGMVERGQWGLAEAVEAGDELARLFGGVPCAGISNGGEILNALKRWRAVKS